MKNYRRSLPPLDYFLFFEAVARTGSFTRAAEELSVSQAAVSKRLKQLEDLLGFALVLRSGRRISLTANGRKLATVASESLEFLNVGLTQIRSTAADEKLSLAANVAVSQFWLTPRINEYLLGRDAVPITLTASDKDSDLFGADNNGLIFYGSDIPSGWEGTRLFEEIWMPLVAPALQHVVPADATLLDFDKLTLKWINWSNFAAITGHDTLNGAGRVNLGSYGSTLDAAIRGKGIALGCPDVLQYEIEAGRLHPLEGYGLRTGRSYFLIWRAGTMTPRVRDLLCQIVGFPI
ncbi:LysR family transcriptional regulator [Roseovarius sp. M141]|uniref:LysR family transcriptional regulator n=1 Tax=Roseovarius sp. M141 TaxID=2583806 RepID=UPI0020CE2660|nr:LysR family transcriptional regulator [Roseovarius sp. M141]MCQ0092697.1 LysR family transcriptional regulator [Roseovarius sp. M141]